MPRQLRDARDIPFAPLGMDEPRAGIYFFRASARNLLKASHEALSAFAS